MVENIRNVKFETFISDINDVIKKEKRSRQEALAITLADILSSRTIKVKTVENTSLAMIFDYDKLNDYGKIIMENSKLVIIVRRGAGDTWSIWKYTDIKEFKNQKLCIDRAKEFVKNCRRDENKQEGYKFIFWSLMVLTVDKTDVEEHLSLICDFAKMLNITDAEMEDIIHVIKVVYNEVEKEYQFKTEIIPNTFGKLFNLYKNNEIPIE